MDLPDKHPIQAADAVKKPSRKTFFFIVALMITFVLSLATLLTVKISNRQQNNQAEELSLPPEEVTQIDAHHDQPEYQWHTVTVNIKARDTLSKIFKEHHLNLTQLNQILALKETKKILAKLPPNAKIKFALDDQNNVQELQYQPDIKTTVHIQRKEDKYVAVIENPLIEKQQSYSHGVITASLFHAGIKANLPSKMILQLVDIFQWDIDFAKSLQPGDTFDVIYEEEYLNGVPVSKGNILSAQFVNKGKKFTAIRYTDPSGHSEYYNVEGHAVKKQFIRAPVKFTRISSYFRPMRWHPVLHRFRKHEGVDYAAPAGTPIKATGGGIIEFMGHKGGYGNAVIIDHGKTITTLYGHLLRYARGLHRYSVVKQGQVIGYVGMSGLATGYHCHYEFRINDKHTDPLKVKLLQGISVPNKYHADFIAQKDRILRRMAIYQRSQMAAADPQKSA